MEDRLLNIDWDKIENFSEEDITYFLFLEGKSIEVIAKIRNLTRETVQKHIIDGKIKYRFLAKSKDEKALFEAIKNAGKLDKLTALNSLDEHNKNKLINYIRKNYIDMYTKDKEIAVWILGELKSSDNIDILRKAVVHNHVNVRRMAVSALGKIGVEASEGILIRTLEDNNPQVVMYSIKALMKIGSTKAIDKLKTIYLSTDKEYIKKSIEQYINTPRSD